MRAKHYDVIIVGAGVIGSSIAYQLTKRGKQVLIVERGKVGCESSRAAAGMLAVQAELDIDNPLYPIAQKSREMFPSLAEEIKDITGRDILLQKNGMLKIAQTEEEVIRFKDITSRQQSVNEEATWLTKQDVLKLEPGLSESTLGAIYFPNESHVSAPIITKAYAELAIHYGAKVKEFCHVENIVSENARCVGIQTNYGEYAADNVVLATGAWSGKWLPKGNFIYPVKGEAFMVKTNPLPIKKTIFGNGCYIVPKKGNELLVGATMKPHTFNKEVTLGSIAGLMQRAMAILPSLSMAEILSFWSGIRPMTCDELPIIGPHPEVNGLYFATGHYRNGILLSPITGHLVANEIIGKREICLNEMRPKRFLGSSLVGAI